MSDFWEMHPPTGDSRYSDSWFVVSKKPFELCPYRYYYLHDDGELRSYCAPVAAMPDTTGYFATEHEAHEAACAYYVNHSKSYPYIEEWSDCYIADGSAQPVTVKEESQVMEFEL